MKVILFGSTGMVGQGVLRECLLDPDVTSIVTVVREATGTGEAKVREVVHRDFLDFSKVASELTGDVVFWCLGVTSAGMSEPDYTRVTHDFTLAAAKAILAGGEPGAKKPTFVFVSGTGADGNAMWARVKRKTEEDLRALPFADLYVFRPGMIQPLHGIKSRTRLYNVLYPVIAPLIWLTKIVRPALVTTTERVGRAMLRIAKQGYVKKLLENPDINAAAAVSTE